MAATITSHSAWRTALGLRVGDAVARLRALYPQARVHTHLNHGWNGYWLVTRNACQESGWAYPTLLARVQGSRVLALVVSASLCAA